MHCRERGFSLVEMLIVLGVVGILSFVTVGAFGSWLVRNRMNLSGRETVALMQRARILAIKRSSTTRIALFRGNLGGYGILQERDPTKAPPDNWVEVEGVRAEVFLSEGAYYTTADNTNLDLPELPSPQAYAFRNDGRIASVSVSDGVIGSDIPNSTLLSLQNRYGHEVRIELRPTGKITIVKKAGEEE